jgi:HEAT repeat protein
LNIWRMQTQGDTPGLIAALGDDDPVVRRGAAAALRTLGAVSAVDALRAAVDREKDLNTRLSLASALRGLLQESADEAREQAEAVNGLIDLLRSGQPARIIEAAEALGRLQNRMAVGPLVVVFNDAKLPGRVRLAAARALLAMNSAPAVVTLLAALDSSDWHIQRNALAVLGHLQADWAVDAIVSHLGAANDTVRRTARAALRRIGTPEAQAALVAASSAGAASDSARAVYQLASASTRPLTPPADLDEGAAAVPPLAPETDMS